MAATKTFVNDFVPTSMILDLLRVLVVVILADAPHCIGRVDI